MNAISSAFDVIVMGGGPGGACAATLVAAAGHRVALLEREEFPRFKIGESLMPATFAVFDRLGVLDPLRKSAFPRKHSVQFFSASGRGSAPFYFAENDPHERSVTWQVLRSDFDQLLVTNAAEHGAEVIHGATVRDVVFDGKRAVGVRAEVDGAVREIGAKVVVDATGQSALIANRLQLMVRDPQLRKAAIFTHFEGAVRDDGRDEGATIILHTEDRKSWFWFIPLPDNRASVGVVGDVEFLVGGGQSPQEVFERELGRCAALQPRLRDARQALEVKVMRDFSYRAREIAGDGWVLVGDAAGFLDPIYSSGVLLALRSGELAADCINEALSAEDLSAERLGRFGPTFTAGMDALKGLVNAFYDDEFSFARFLGRHPQYRSDIIDLLTGDVFDRDFSAMFAAMAEK